MAMGLFSPQLEAFWVLAQTRHFTRAAKRLGLCQSALSQRIMNLEEELSTVLFVRDPSGVRLTEAGTELLRYCQASEPLQSELLMNLKGLNFGAEHLVGEVRVAGFSSVMRSVVLPALQDLIKAHSNLKLNLLTRELIELPLLLRSGAVDFLFVNRRLDEDRFISEEVGQEENVLVEKEHYDGPEVYLDHDEEDETTLNYFQLTGKPPRNLQRRYLDDVYGILEGARMGLGKAVVPLHLIRGDRSLRVVNPSKRLVTPVFLVYYRQAFYSRLQKEIIASLRASAKHYK